MVDGGGGTTFSVVFYDGEREIDIGSVRIYPSLEYKPFQHMVSQKIGISPNQISIYLLERKRSPSSSVFEDKRKMPITGKVNFASICRMRDCCFLAVLKRSRKARIRRDSSGINAVDFADYLPGGDQDYHPNPQPMMHYPPVLLRRNQGLPIYDQVVGKMFQRENYERVNDFDLAYDIANMSNYGFDPVLDVGLDPYSVVSDSYVPQTPMNMNVHKVWCETCLLANSTSSFHPCINDVVVTRFETRAGPIQRRINVSSDIVLGDLAF